MSFLFDGRVKNYKDEEGHTYEIPLLKRRNSIIRSVIGAILFIAYLIYSFFYSGKDIASHIVLVTLFIIFIIIYLFIILWVLRGKEILKINRDYLIIKNTFSIFGIKKKYEMDVIKDIRINIDYRENKRLKINLGSFLHLIGYKTGFVIFKYKDKEVQFGSGLNFNEANFFVEEIKRLKA